MDRFVYLFSVFGLIVIAIASTFIWTRLTENEFGSGDIFSAVRKFMTEFSKEGADKKSVIADYYGCIMYLCIIGIIIVAIIIHLYRLITF